MQRFGLICALIVCSASTLFAVDASPNALLFQVADFSLKDHRGKAYSLSELESSKLVVLAVLGTECPLAKQCALKLQKLAADYANRGVTILAIDPNRQDSLTEIAAFIKANELTFPVLKDLNQQVSDSFRATRTPEVFVLDSHRMIRYRGRVDDQFAVGGKFRKSPTRDDLKRAIDELLEGKSVSVPETPAMGCLIGRTRESKPDSTVTYSNQVCRVLQKHCVECHRPGEIAPFSLTEYQEVAGWADMIVEVTQSHQMPPWHASPEFGHFSNDRRLSQEEIDLLQAWAKSGAPEGNPAELPEPRTFVEGWQLPRQPDHVVQMADKPFAIPAEGTVRYQYFVVDSGLTEEKWLAAAEIIPSNRGVVHHVIVFMATDEKVSDEARQTVTAYVPGYRINPLPKGMAKRIPKGSKFIFQMHYTPNGTAGEDLTKVGLVFANPDEVTQEVRTAAVMNNRFKIEPEKDEQSFESRVITLPSEVQLLSLAPHMHLRGKSFRYELTSPDGKTETLLDVPHYDFNWQTSYRLAEPRILALGSKLKGYASFDNSSNNVANPDPSKTVTWGEQSWDEMLLGYFDFAMPRGSEDAAKMLAGPGGRAQDPKEIAKRIFESLDKNKDGNITIDEVGPAQKPFFTLIDADKDGTVSKTEVEAKLPELIKLLRP